MTELHGPEPVQLEVAVEIAAVTDARERRRTFFHIVLLVVIVNNVLLLVEVTDLKRHGPQRGSLRVQSRSKIEFVNDPLGQTHNLASISLFSLDFEKWGRTRGRTD